MNNILLLHKHFGKRSDERCSGLSFCIGIQCVIYLLERHTLSIRIYFVWYTNKTTCVLTFYTWSGMRSPCRGGRCRGASGPSSSSDTRPPSWSHHRSPAWSAGSQLETIQEWLTTRNRKKFSKENLVTDIKPILFPIFKDVQYCGIHYLFKHARL